METYKLCEFLDRKFLITRHVTQISTYELCLDMSIFTIAENTDSIMIPYNNQHKI